MSELFAIRLGGKSEIDFFHSYIIHSINNKYSNNRIDDYRMFGEENKRIKLFSIQKNGDDNSFINNSNEKSDNSFPFNFYHQNFRNIKTDILFYYLNLDEKNESFFKNNGLFDDDVDRFPIPIAPTAIEIPLFKVVRPGTRLYDEDNIIKKIKVHYINFDFKFINYLLKKKGRIDLHLQDLEQELKINVDKNCLSNMKNQKLEDVLCNGTDYNKKQLEKIKKEPNLEDIIYILNKSFLFLFECIYYPKRKYKYNLNEFGRLESFEFALPKNILLYEDLLEKNKKKPKNFDFDFEEYKKKMDKCCKKYFFQAKNLFIVRKIKGKRK